MVYYYCRRDLVEKALSEGITIREFGERRKFGYKDINLPVISSFLSPFEGFEEKDDLKYVCLELQVDQKDCYAADRDLWRAFQSNPRNYELRRLYNKSAVKLSSYNYGKYRIAEILISKDVKPENIKIYTSNNREANLFTEKFNPYYGSVLEEIREDKGDALVLYFYCENMAGKGLFQFVDELYENGKQIRIYYDRAESKCINVVSQKEWGME